MNRIPSYRKSDCAPIGVFIAVAVVVFFLALSAADSVGFVPCEIDGTCVTRESVSDLWSAASELTPLRKIEASTTPETKGIEPSRIRISAIDLDLPVQNPETTDLEKLDLLLQSGPARFSPSALLGQSGTMIVFAHSSHLPIVHNQMYRAFNRIPELKSGDNITIEGGEASYLYSVVDVKKVDVNDADATIDLSTNKGTHLTLVTCDTLTGKSARFVVEAVFVGTL